MFCPKCGIKIADDSLFCYKCGEKITKSSMDESDSSATEMPSQGEQSVLKNNTVLSSKPLLLKCIAGSLILIILVVIIIVSIQSSQSCSYSGCTNKKVDGGKYCSEHTCQVSGCFLMKSKSDTYCYLHECEDYSCKKKKATNSDYCSEHTCSESTCYEKVVNGTNYCAMHQIDMRSMLTRTSFYFSLNSAGGIKFNFSATNSSGKTIKYIRFKVYLRNAVGDTITDDIKRNGYIDVEIIGPYSANSSINYNELIGYCDNLSQININNITLVYSDGSTDTGSFNYYYKK